MTILLDNIWFKYPGSREWILRGVNASFREGKLSVITGPNGSGKTTLLKVSSIIYKPQRGTIKAWGIDVWNIDEKTRLKIRRNIVYVHEKPILLRGNALFNIAYGLMIRGVDANKALKIAENFLDKIGLSYLRNKYPRELSMGEAHLVAILRAIVLKPRMLLLDEPMTYLDTKRKRIVYSLLKELKETGTGLAIVTHDAYTLANLVDEILILEDGKISKINENDE